jgi:tetratricopeptide (TPR) repeat protein
VLSEAVRLHPQDLGTLAQLAEIRLALEDYTGAQRAAAQMAGLPGGAPMADRVNAALLAAQGRIDESISMLETIVDEAESGDAALANLVAGYVQTGEVDRAVALLDERIAADPADIVAQVLRAELHLREGNTDAAEAGLRQIVALRPASATGHLVLTRFLLSQERVSEATAAAEAGITASTQNGALRLLLANIYETRGEFDAAIDQYEALYAAEPRSLVAANNLASLIAEYREDDADAIERAARIARRLRGSELPHFQDTYGWLAFLNDNLTEALANLEPAAQSLPQNPLVRYHFGRALVASGESERGRTELEAALQIDPTFSKAESARQALARLDNATQ